MSRTITNGDYWNAVENTVDILLEEYPGDEYDNFDSYAMEASDETAQFEDWFVRSSYGLVTYAQILEYTGNRNQAVEYANGHNLGIEDSLRLAAMHAYSCDLLAGLWAAKREDNC